MPPTPDFCVGDTNMLVSKMWKCAFPDAKLPTPNLKFALAPTPNPDASQWNIGGVGSQRKMLASGMYISCFLCRFHLRRAPNANPFFGGIWALVFFFFFFWLIFDCNWVQHSWSSTRSHWTWKLLIKWSRRIYYYKVDLVMPLKWREMMWWNEMRWK